MPIIRPRIRLMSDCHTPTHTSRRVDLSDNDFSALVMALDSETGRAFPIPICRFIGENFATAIVKYRIRSTVPGHARRVTRYVVVTRILVNHGGNCASSEHPPYRTVTLRAARAHLRIIHRGFGIETHSRSRVPYHVAVARSRRESIFPREVDVDDVRCRVCGEHGMDMLCAGCASQGRDAATGEL